jgi:hypothetical protein
MKLPDDFKDFALFLLGFAILAVHDPITLIGVFLISYSSYITVFKEGFRNE